MAHARISGTGGYLPKQCVTNDDLAKRVDTSHEWIVERSGICQRHIAAADETTTSMAEAAAQAALNDAGLDASEVDLIIVATCTGEYAFPSVACEIQHRLGAVKAAAFDVSAACAGFVYALVTASQFIQSGAYQHVLVVGAEHISKVLDWADRTTCVLFGDGAGATVLSRSETPGIFTV